MVDARVLRLHLGLLSAKAYLVCALTGLREGRGEPYRQCQSKLCEEYICSSPTNRPNVSLFYFFIFLSLSSQRGHNLPAFPIEEWRAACYCCSLAYFSVCLRTVDQSLFSSTGIVLLCKVTPVIPR